MDLKSEGEPLNPSAIYEYLNDIYYICMYMFTTYYINTYYIEKHTYLYMYVCI